VKWAEAYLRAKFHLDPSKRLAYINVTDRQGSQTGCFFNSNTMYVDLSNGV